MSTVGICSCAGNFNNLGSGSDCLPLLEAPQNIVFALTKKNSGVDNAVLTAGLLDLAAMDLLFEAEIAHDRFYPLNTIKEFTSEPAEEVTEESASGAIRNVRKGRASVTYRVWSNNPGKLAEKLETLKCLGGLGVFIVDTAGNLIGKGNSSDNLIPRGIEDNSLSIVAVPHALDAGGSVDIKWTYTINSGEETVEYIQADDFAADFDLLDVLPLEDANISSLASASTTACTFNLYKDFGSLGNRLPVKGMGGTDLLEVYNVTGAATVAFATLVESPDGTYSGTFSAQTSTNVFRIQGKTGVTIQNGFDLKRIDDTTALIG